jgi:hypothetical protein
MLQSPVPVAGPSGIAGLILAAFSRGGDVVRPGAKKALQNAGLEFISFRLMPDNHAERGERVAAWIGLLLR